MITHVNANSNINQLPYYWNFINVEIDIQENGDMLIAETHQYVFNREYSNRRYRYIPLEKVDDIKDISVWENNKLVPFKFGKKDNQLWIQWEHKLNPPEAHTFIIKYRVVGGLHFNSDSAQVYWKAIFKDRQSPIQNAKVTVKFPESLAGKINSFTHYAAYIPVFSQKLDSKTVEFIAQEPIPQGQELEVQISFPHNILDMELPKWQQSPEANGDKLGIKDIVYICIVYLFSLFGLFGLSLLFVGGGGGR